MAYDYVEAFAEKFRALAERTRPRDLYDVVNLYRNTDARPEQQQFVQVLREKCDFKGIALPQLADIQQHRADVEAGWVHMLNHQLPALLPVNSFWDALGEIFDWLHGQVLAPALAPMSFGANDAVIRDRVIGLPASGQSLIAMIRFAAANRLLVEIDYRDKAGARSTRTIEAYSLRRSQAGDILLMAVRAEDSKPRSYLVSNILGVTPTQTSFNPQYPIELTPSGLQIIPDTSRSAGTTPSRLPRMTRRRTTQTGPVYVYRCNVCRKLFERKSQDSSLRPHKNQAGWQCHGTYGTLVRTKY